MHKSPCVGGREALDGAPCPAQEGLWCVIHPQERELPGWRSQSPAGARAFPPLGVGRPWVWTPNLKASSKASLLGPLLV